MASLLVLLFIASTALFVSAWKQPGRWILWKGKKARTRAQSLWYGLAAMVFLMAAGAFAPSQKKAPVERRDPKERTVSPEQAALEQEASLLAADPVANAAKLHAVAVKLKSLEGVPDALRGAVFRALKTLCREKLVGAKDPTAAIAIMAEVGALLSGWEAARKAAGATLFGLADETLTRALAAQGPDRDAIAGSADALAVAGLSHDAQSETGRALQASIALLKKGDAEAHEHFKDRHDAGDLVGARRALAVLTALHPRSRFLWRDKAALAQLEKKTPPLPAVDPTDPVAMEKFVAEEKRRREAAEKAEANRKRLEGRPFIAIHPDNLAERLIAADDPNITFDKHFRGKYVRWKGEYDRKGIIVKFIASTGRLTSLSCKDFDRAHESGAFKPSRGSDLIVEGKLAVIQLQLGKEKLEFILTDCIARTE
jgi:hypothetical protein